MKSIVIFSIFCLSVVAGEKIKRQVNPNFQGFPAFSAFPQPNFNIRPGPGTQTSSTFTSQTLSSRFGDSRPVVTGQTTQFTSSGNNYQQTNTILRPDGSVQTNRQSGRVRRETTPKKDEKILKEQNVITPKQQIAPKPPVNPQQNKPNNQQQPGNRPVNQQQPNYPQQQPNYPQQQPYPQQPYPQQPIPAAQFPFGIGFFAQPQFGFQGPFGFGSFGFPQQGFQQPGFQQGFPQQPIPQQGIPSQGTFVGASQTLDNRFGEEEGVVSTGGSQIITSQNGNYHITSSVLKPNGQVVTTQQSGTINKKP